MSTAQFATASRLLAAAAFTATAVLAGTGVAAADEWPQVPDYPSAVVISETSHFLTATDPDFWNPLVNADRLTSPYGTSTRIVCTSFHGGTMGCWQADEAGEPHLLTTLPVNLPSVGSSSSTSGGPRHYVFPGFIPGIG